MIVDLMDLLDDEYKRINTKQQDLFTVARQHAATGNLGEYRDVRRRACELTKAQFDIVRKMNFIKRRRANAW